MKARVIVTAVAVVVLVFGISSAFAGLNGNGAPSGPHYNLNIIGVPQDKNVNMNQGSGSVIFVDLGTKGKTPVETDIMLSPSTDGTFSVLDKNGTDGTASFQLPAPGSYTVWARALGTPFGSATMSTCAVDPADPTVVICNAGKMFFRDTGKSTKFTDVTSVLTTITLTSAQQLLTGCSATVSLFDPCLEGYFWKYDNSGLKILQVRFYPDS